MLIQTDSWIDETLFTRCACEYQLMCYQQKGGVIAGGVIGSLFALASIAGIVFAVAYYKKSKNTDGVLCGCVIGEGYRKRSICIRCLTVFGSVDNVCCMYVCMHACASVYSCVCMYACVCLCLQPTWTITIMPTTSFLETPTYNK